MTTPAELAEFNAGTRRARAAYHGRIESDGPSDVCVDCGVNPRYAKGRLCNPCKYVRLKARRAAR